MATLRAETVNWRTYYATEGELVTCEQAIAGLEAQRDALRAFRDGDGTWPSIGVGVEHSETCGGPQPIGQTLYAHLTHLRNKADIDAEIEQVRHLLGDERYQRALLLRAVAPFRGSLAAMGPDERALAEAYYRDKYKQAEIAERLGISIDAVQDRISRIPSPKKSG
jgi:hypothetical protein